MGIEFTILSHGVIENDIAWNLSVPNPASKFDKDPSTQWVSVPSFSILIKHPQVGYILYDTGSCPGDEKDRRPEYAQTYFPFYAKREDFLDARLKELGVELEDISVIVVSHMHWDHSGGLKLFKGTKAGQNILVHKKDFEYGLVETHRSSDVPFAGGGYYKDNFEFEGLSYELIEEDQELAEGIDIIMLAGHTPGILGLIVHLDSGTYIFTSDALYMQKNYGPPVIVPGIVYDTIAFQEGIKKLRKLEKKYNAKIIFGHDIEQFAELKKAPYFYK